MTTIAPELPVAAEWRQLGRYLWTGRRDGRPIGMIEQGRWFVLTDEQGESAGRFRTLADAQTAAADPAQRAALQVHAHRGAVAGPLAVVVAGGVAIGSTALAALHLV